MNKKLVTIEGTIKDIDLLIKTIKYLKEHDTFLGLPKGTSTDVLTKGVANEYGTVNIPQRSWLRKTLIRKSNVVNKRIETEIINALQLKQSGEIAYKRIGIGVTNIVKAQFDNGGDGTWKELAQSTIERKGNTTILVETGDMRRSITYVVRKNK